MKKIIFTMTLFFTTFAFADGPTQEHAMAVSEQFQGFLASPKVTGVGIGACNGSGQKLKDFNQPYVICVMIQVSDALTASAFEQIFPPGTMNDNTFVAVEIRGRLRF